MVSFNTILRVGSVSNIALVIIACGSFCHTISPSTAFSVLTTISKPKTTTAFNNNQQRQFGKRMLLFSAATSSSSLAVNNVQVPDGIIKSITKKGYGRQVQLGDIATVKYSCYLAPDSSTTTGGTSSSLPFAKSNSQKFVIGDGSMIDGWDKALRTMYIGERSIVRIIDSKLGYGSQGVPPFIPANGIIEMDIEIIDTVLASNNIDFDSLANLADKTPMTAVDIANAYSVRQQEKYLLEKDKIQLEGLDAFIEKVKNFYFYGLFEGETGERPPWFLRPSITFPIAFAIVGLAFYVSLAGGAISERGQQSTDELDEIILSSISSSTNFNVQSSPLKTSSSLLSISELSLLATARTFSNDPTILM